MKSKFSWIHQKVWLLIVSFRHNSRKSSNFSQNIFLIKSISIDLALAHVVWKTQWGEKKVFNMESCFNIAEEKEDPKSRATIGKGDIRNCFSTKSSRKSRSTFLSTTWIYPALDNYVFDFGFKWPLTMFWKVH